MNEQELNGIWWLPELVDKKIAGVLKISPNGKATLSLLGSFTGLPREMFSILYRNNPENNIIILGITDSGKKVTLYDCHLAGEKISFNGFTTQIFSPSFTYVGALIEKVEHFKFDKFIFSLSNLSHWLCKSGFKQDYKSNNDRVNKITYTYSFPNEIEILMENFKLKINQSLVQKGSIQTSLCLSEETYFFIELQESLDIYDIITTYVRPLQNLITYSTNKASFVKSLLVYSDIFKTKINDEETINNRIDVFFRTDDEENKNTDSLLKYDLVLRADDIVRT